MRNTLSCINNCSHITTLCHQILNQSDGSFSAIRCDLSHGSNPRGYPAILQAYTYKCCCPATVIAIISDNFLKNRVCFIDKKQYTC